MSRRQRPLDSRAEELIRRFAIGSTSNDEVRTLRVAIETSRALSRQINQAIRAGTLRRIVLLDHANAVGEYHAPNRTIKLSPSILASPGLIAFVLGHEVQHALNSHVAAHASRVFRREIRRAAATDQNYTTAVQNLIRASRWDESTANLAGWNALVDHARDGRRPLWLGRVLRAVPHGTLFDFIEDVGGEAYVHPEFEISRDLTIEMTTRNIESMARRFFDKTPELTRLGGRGSSDYANYYAAWAIGQAARVHAAVSSGRPMRIDLARLGLSRKLMEESGIDLAGIKELAYVDESTQPPTRDTLHHTVGTFTYIPPTAPYENRSMEAARLAAVGFALPATEAIRPPTLCGSSISHHAGSSGVRRRPKLGAASTTRPERRSR